MAKKKVQKRRGSREHGRGRKAGRGAGLRGGKGNSGSFGHRFTEFYQKYGERYFGDHGFKRPDAVVDEQKVLNVGDLARNLEALEEEGHLEWDGDTAVIDLEAAGYDKLLGAGRVHHTFQVKVPATTDKASEKIQANGGSIELTADEEEEGGDASPPSDD